MSPRMASTRLMSGLLVLIAAISTTGMYTIKRCFMLRYVSLACSIHVHTRKQVLDKGNYKDVIMPHPILTSHNAYIVTSDDVLKTQYGAMIVMKSLKCHIENMFQL